MGSGTCARPSGSAAGCHDDGALAITDSERIPPSPRHESLRAGGPHIADKGHAYTPTRSAGATDRAGRRQVIRPRPDSADRAVLAALASCCQLCCVPTGWSHRAQARSAPKNCCFQVHVGAGDDIGVSGRCNSGPRGGLRPGGGSADAPRYRPERIHRGACTAGERPRGCSWPLACQRPPGGGSR